MVIRLTFLGKKRNSLIWNFLQDFKTRERIRCHEDRGNQDIIRNAQMPMIGLYQGPMAHRALGHQRRLSRDPRNDLGQQFSECGPGDALGWAVRDPRSHFKVSTRPKLFS